MPITELEDYYEHLRKAGLASFTVILKAAPGDATFLHDDPVAHVTVTATDPATGKVVTQFSQMSAAAAQLDVEIAVLNAAGVLKGIWRRFRGTEKPKLFDVKITVEPHPDWANQYSRREFPLEVKPGSNPRQHIWMVRTQSGHTPDESRKV